MSYGPPLIFYDDEDEAALISRFVEMSANWPNESPFAVTAYLFSQLQESGRSFQAATKWSNDLAIKERIRLYRINGEEKPLLTKEQWKAQILAATQDDRMTPQEKKSKLDGLRLYGETEGWLVKAIEKKVEHNPGAKRFPVIMFKRYEDAA